ncbi:MAG: Hint domain-containing protein [Tabrizicola sp.]|jgi:hypothetical protein|nr:Hint domain-containing protein [Tabrizicola sp.]
MDIESQNARVDGADHAQPLVGGVLEGTQVSTLDGFLPVEYLQPGDRIVTRSGARKLKAVSVLRRRAMTLIRIRASVLGHDRPETDVLVAPAQCVMVRDWRARALYRQDVAAIPAERLEDGEFVVRELHSHVRLFTLRFDDDEVIYADGLELACPAVVAEPALS